MESNDLKVSINLDSYVPLRDLVYDSIRNAILNDNIKQGRRLTETQLAKVLGVSRTPIREALRRLESEGFIEIIPRKGAVVKIMGSKELQNVLEVRSVLEGLAAKLASYNINTKNEQELIDAKNKFYRAFKEDNKDAMIEHDIELHDLIFSISDNDKLVQIVNNLHEQTYRYRVIYINDKNYLKSIVDEHEELVDAIINKDSSKAESIASLHIKNQKYAVLDILEKENFY